MASSPVRPSNNAVCGRPASGRTDPAGARVSGGDSAACAGAIVAGMSSKVFFEHAVGSTSENSSPIAVIRRTHASCLGFAGTG